MPSGSPSAPSTALRWFPWISITGLLVVRLCHEWFGPDIWYHLALGERIAHTGQAQPADALLLQQPAFVNVYWLFQLLARGVFALGGIIGVSLLFVTCWLAALACWVRTTGALRSAPWGVGLALVAVLVCQTRFEERPEVFSFLFLALEIHWLANWRLDTPVPPRALVLFAIVQVLWSNMHGYFVLGPLLVAAKIISVALDTPREEWPKVRPTWRGLWLLAALTVGATVASPFGLRNWTGVLALWKFFGAMRYEVQEFLPPSKAFLNLWTVKLFWAWWATAALAWVCVLVAAARRETFALLLAAAGLWLSATSFRNIPLVIFFTAPLAAVVLRRLAGFRPLERVSTLGTGVGAIALAGTAVAGTFGPSGFGIRELPTASPIQFAAFWRGTEFRGTLFNHPADGGYLAFYFPTLRLYGDSRYVEAEPIHDYFAALHRPDAFRALDERHHFDAALFKVAESRPVLVTLVTDPRWKIVYADLHRALLANSDGAKRVSVPVGPRTFYRGEDLALPANAASALQWAALFAEANQPERFFAVVTEFGAAPHIPAPIIETALRYGLAIRSPPILALARRLRPKMIVAKPIDAAVIDRLIAQSTTP